MPIYFGVDVSQFQGVINMATLKSVKDFVIIKATGGDAGLYTDSRFGTNQSNARSAGIKRGYYHFGGDGTNTPTAEANYFTTAVGALQAGEVMILDAETTTSRTPSWAKTFLDQVTANIGFKPLIYMSSSYTSSINWSTVAGAGYRLWVANYAVSPTGSNLYVGAWTDLGMGYPIHQYTSSGVVAGIGSNPVDLDAFFVPTGGTIDNWDNYGKFGTTPTGGGGGAPLVIQAGVDHNATGSTNSSYTQSNPSSIITPTEAYDQVIYSVVTTDAVLATGTHTGFYGIPTPINQTAYPIGIFSYDGGDSYNDFGVTLPIPTTYTPLQPGVQIQPTVDNSGGISFTGINNTGSTVNLILKIALLASYAPGPVKTPPTLTETTSYTNNAQPIPSPTFQAQFLPPYSSYRRIAKDSASGTGASIDVAHGQSTIPNLMFWVQNAAKTYTTINAVGWASNGPLGAIGIYMDSTNVHFHVDAATFANAYYRIYKDNV